MSASAAPAGGTSYPDANNSIDLASGQLGTAPSTHLATNPKERMKKFYLLALALFTLTIANSSCSQSPQMEQMDRLEDLLDQIEEVTDKFTEGDITQSEFTRQMSKFSSKLDQFDGLESMKLNKEEKERYTELQARGIRIFLVAASAADANGIGDADL